MEMSLTPFLPLVQNVYTWAQNKFLLHNDVGNVYQWQHVNLPAPGVFPEGDPVTGGFGKI